MTWYTGDPTYDTLLALGFAIAVLTAVAACFTRAPYGRFAARRSRVGLNPRLGWFLMELPALVVFLLFYFRGPNAFAPFPLFALFVWVVHYANRGFVMPALMRVPRGASGFGLPVVLVGWVVTSLHGFLNGSWISTHAPHVGWDWFSDPRFIAGVVLYYGGLAVNLHSDHVLRTLRTREEVAQGTRVYRMPRGGLFEQVSNPSYLSELVFWAGFALFTWSLAGVFILAISLANLVPRAVATHAWYRERFPEYPPQRRILVPFLW